MGTVGLRDGSVGGLDGASGGHESAAAGLVALGKTDQALGDRIVADPADLGDPETANLASEGVPAELSRIGLDEAQEGLQDLLISLLVCKSPGLLIVDGRTEQRRRSVG
jgi:hypothetical protein